MTTLDSRLWDAFARDNAYFHTVSWESFRQPNEQARQHYWQSGEAFVKGVLLDFGIETSLGTVALEIGSGLGRLTLPLARRCGRAIGIDVSAEMVAAAQTEAQSAGIENVRYLHGDGESLQPIKDKSIDLVLCYTVFQHLSNRRLMRGYVWETARVLRSGGVAILQCPTWQVGTRSLNLLKQLPKMAKDLAAPSELYWRIQSAMQRRRDVASLNERLAATEENILAGDGMRHAMRHPARRMKAVHWLRLCRWIHEAGLSTVSYCKPGQTYTLICARKL